MASKKAVTVTLENVGLIFRNFAGEEKQFNKAGDRNFAVRLDPETAAMMENDGWNIKRKEPRDPDEDPLAFIKVSVNFNPYPPRVILISGSGAKKHKQTLSEDMISMLDWAEIEKADLVLRAYDWTVNGNSGRKAYLKAAYVTIVEDALAEKYYDIPDEVPDSSDVEYDEDGPF